MTPKRKAQTLLHRICKKCCLVFAIFLIGLFLIKDTLIKVVAEKYGSKIVGARLEIGQFSSSLLKQKIQLKNIVLYNPPGFPDEPLIQVPELTVQYDLNAFRGGKMHFLLVVVHTKEMTVIRNEQKQLNVDNLKVVKDQKAQLAKERAKGNPPQTNKPINIQIDQLKLNVGRVVYKDFSKGSPPVIQVYDIALKDKDFKNLDSVQELITVVMVNAMAPTAIKSAQIYGVAAMLGVGFLPAGIAASLVGKDEAYRGFTISYEDAFKNIADLMIRLGEMKLQDRGKGLIKAKVHGNDITVKIQKMAAKNVQVTVTARKFLMPKPQVAAGVLYQIAEKLDSL